MAFMTTEAGRIHPDTLCLRMLRLWKRLTRSRRRAPRRLRLSESLPLGEHRFVAVIEFEQSRFLLGVTSSSLVLLARLAQPDVESAPARETHDNAVKEILQGAL